MSTGEANGLPPDRPLCTATTGTPVSRTVCRKAAPIWGAAGSWSSRYHPLGEWVYAFHAHSSWTAAMSTIAASATSSGPDVGDGVTLDEDPAVTAQLGGERLAPLHGVDRERVGGADDGHGGDHGDGGVAAGQHEVAPVRGREAVDRVGLAAGPLRELGSPLPGLRKWVCTSTTVSTSVRPSSRSSWRAELDVVGPWTVAIASSTSVAAVSGTENRPPGSVPCERRLLVAAGLEHAQPRRHARRRQQESAAGPTMAAGVLVGGGAGPAHRLTPQVVERWRQVLPVGARPELQWQAGIDVEIGLIHHRMLALAGLSSCRRAATAPAGSPAVTSDSPTRMAS